MPDAKDKGTLTKIKVLSCEAGYRGQKNGNAYTIYNLTAERENGDAITQKLNSFEEIPLGELMEVFVKPHTHNERTSYTVTRKNRPSSHQKIDELKARVETLENYLRTKPWQT